MRATNIEQIEQKQLPGRAVKVLTEALPTENLTVGICEVPPRSTMDPHHHVEEEVIYILEGHGHCNVEGDDIPIEPDTLVHFPSDVEHFTANESDEVMRFVFCFSPTVVVGSYG